MDAEAHTNDLQALKQEANIVHVLSKNTTFTDVALFGSAPPPTGQEDAGSAALQPVRAHKAVLAAGSDFFNTLFSNTTFDDSQKNEYTLDKVNHECLKLVVETLYAGDVLNDRIISDVKVACDVLVSFKYLLMNELASACENVLIKHHLTIPHCIFLWKFACKYVDMPRLTTEVEAFMAMSLSKLMLEQSFLTMKLDEICRMLLTESVKFSTSADVRFRSAFAWLEHDVGERRIFLHDILSIIPLTPGKISRASLKKACDSDVLVDPAIKTLLLCSLDVDGFVAEPEFTWHVLSAVSTKCFSSPHNEVSSIFCVGGYPFGTEKEFLKYNVISKSWQRLNPLPWKRYHSGACVVGERLIIFGGQEDEKNSSSIAEYDISSEDSSWITHQSTQLPEASFNWLACNVRNKSAYVGGVRTHLLEYESPKNVFKTKPCTLSERAGGSSMVYSQTSDAVYVAGGSSTKNIDMFDVTSNAWQTIGAMTAYRAYLCSVLCGEIIYLISGCDHGKSVEGFDIQTGKVCKVSDLLEERYGSQAALLYNNVICVFGGGQKKSVEAYDVREGKWTAGVVVPDMPIVNSYFSLAWK